MCLCVCVSVICRQLISEEFTYQACLSLVSQVNYLSPYNFRRLRGATESRSTRSGGNLFIHKPKKNLGKPQLPHWYYCMTPTSQILNSRACLYNSCTWTKTYMYIITSKFHLRNHIECHIDRLSFILPGFCLCSFLCHPRYRSWVLPNQQFFSCSHGQNKNLLTQGRVSFNKLDRTSDAAFHG